MLCRTGFVRSGCRSFPGRLRSRRPVAASRISKQSMHLWHNAGGSFPLLPVSKSSFSSLCLKLSITKKTVSANETFCQGKCDILSSVMQQKSVYFQRKGSPRDMRRPSWICSSSSSKRSSAANAADRWVSARRDTEKSLLTWQLFPAWALGRNPSRSSIAPSYGQSLAIDVGRMVRNFIAENLHGASSLPARSQATAQLRSGALAGSMTSAREAR